MAKETLFDDLLALLRTRKRVVIAISSLPLFSIVAAFGIAPQTELQNVPLRTVVQNVELPRTAQAQMAEGDFWQTEKIRRGDTIAAVLERLNVNDEEIQAFLQSSKDSKVLRQLVPGRSVQARTSADGGLLTFRYFNGNDAVVTIERDGSGYKTQEQAPPLERRVIVKSAQIKSSLFAATDAANIPDAIATQVADIFSSDIDFHLDLRRGDQFSVVYEGFYHNGDPVKVGRVLAAEFVNKGKAFRAVYFTDPEGRGGYYTPSGENLRKAFLRSPLEFSRISSGFTLSRFHPVLQTWRAHKGVDYAAAPGTRVRATADGVVKFAGWQGGYGNVVVVQHQGQYSTAYGHLSRFGVKNGQHVNQGDVIGFVGSTGLATGPHLHYEFRIGGVQRDPLSVAMPVAFPIAPHYRQEFARLSGPLLERLQLLRNTNLASLE